MSLSETESKTEISARLGFLREDAQRLSKASQATVIQKIETQAALTPNAIALVGQTETLTYQQLNQNANQLAHFLQQQGVGTGSLVAIQLMRSPAAIIAFLAVLKAGAAYIPIDPSYPQHRRHYILQDAQAALLLTESSLCQADDLLESSLCIQIDTQSDTVAQQSTANLDVAITPDDIAYVIYTSGTTGHPKGVMIRHEGLVNHATAMARAFHLTSSDRMLQFSSLSFDIIVEEIYPTLIKGAALVLRPEDIATSMSRFFEFTAAEKVTILDLPTAFWHELVGALARRSKTGSETDQIPPQNLSQSTSENTFQARDSGTSQLSPSIRLVVVGGEEASLARYAQWRSIVGDYPRWLNTYGPTETTVSATLYDPIAENFDLSHKLPIGRAIDNVQTYVLKPTQDQNSLQHVEPGEPGKLYIGGLGLAKGYLNKPDKTAAAFVAHPFVAGERLYDTGDIVRQMPDGNLVFIGRADFQVKIRGFRIELDEVARCLEEYPLIQQQVVLVREDRFEEKRLVAYVVPKTAQDAAQQDKVLDKALDITALKSFMQTKLPDYMVPSAFVVLKALPTNANGKVDRSALQALPAPVCTQGYAPPVTEVEKTLTHFWQNLLSVKTVGINDNFFELGGTSLTAVRLFSLIEEAFGQKLPLTVLLQSSTPAKLGRTIETLLSSDRLSDNHKHLWESLVPLQTRGSKPPLFFLHAVGPSILNYQNLLPYLDNDQPVYALQAKGLDGERPLIDRMEKMAAEYIQDIKGVQPQGPYYFAGHSFGGLMAFEMAHQLISQGETIGFLGLFDAATPALTYCQTPPWIYQMYIHGLNFSDAKGFYPKWQYLESRATPIFRKFLDKGLATIGLLAESVVEPLPEIYRRIEAVDRAALKRYAPQPYPSKMTLFRAQEKDPKQFHDDQLGWRYLAEGGLEIHDVPGHHLSIMLEPHVATLATRLQECLDKAYLEE